MKKQVRKFVQAGQEKLRLTHSCCDVPSEEINLSTNGAVPMNMDNIA